MFAFDLVYIIRDHLMQQYLVARTGLICCVLVQTPEHLDNVLTILQQQQELILRLNETVNDLSMQVHQQTAKGEQTDKKQSEEREQMKVLIQSLQKSSSSNLSRAAREVSKACCILSLHCCIVIS